MNKVDLIARIFAGISLLFSALAVFYLLIIDKKRKAFLRDIKKDAEDNPNEIVTYLTIERFNYLYVKSTKFIIVFIVITAVLGVISVLVRDLLLP